MLTIRGVLRPTEL